MGTNYYWQKGEGACPTCGPDRGGCRKHIGKSSAGWTFALRVYPEEGINDLIDWIPLLADSRAKIVHEYGSTIGLQYLLQVIMNRGRAEPPTIDLDRNHAILGPNNLVRAKLGPPHGAVSYGSGTWDCFDREFS